MMDRNANKPSILDIWKDGMREVMEWQARSEDRITF